MPLSHPAISSTSSPTTCCSSPGTNLNDPTHTHANCSSTSKPATCSSTLEATSTILPTPMPVAYSPPNWQQVLLTMETTSTILSTHLPLAHLVITSPPNLQPPFLARINLNYPIHTHATFSSSNFIYIFHGKLLFELWNQPQRFYPHPCRMVIHLLTSNLLF